MPEAYAMGVTPPIPPGNPPTYAQMLRQQERVEERAVARTKRLIERLLDAAEPIWQQGDGMGGGVMLMIDNAARERGLPTPKHRA